MLGHLQAAMFPKKPCGKDKVRKGMKEIKQRLKLTYWKSFRGQVLRPIMYTKLNNDNSINITESIAALQHRSAAAHEYCNKTSSTSECNKYKVLGIIKKK